MGYQLAYLPTLSMLPRSTKRLDGISVSDLILYSQGWSKNFGLERSIETMLNLELMLNPSNNLSFAA